MKEIEFSVYTLIITKSVILRLTCYTVASYESILKEVREPVIPRN